MDTVLNAVVGVNGFLWGYFLIFLLCGTGAFFTIYLGGIQIKKFGAGFKNLFGSFSLSGDKAGKDGMSPFQAVTTAIAAQVGTGNLVGAATAVVMGGPGALFWMWLAAFFGMATIFVEAILAQHYKTKDETGQTVGGPAYYITRGLKQKWLGAIFSVCLILALGFMGNMVQSNSISDAFNQAFGINPLIIGVILAILAGLIIFKGISAIAAFAEKAVPIMAGLYITVGLLVIIMNIGAIPGVIVAIFKGAFNPQSVLGGAVGIGIAQAMRYGIARGLFSNEAGMGSTPHSHAVATVDEPVKQGTLAIVSVFIDTFIILNISAFTILTSGVVQYDADGTPLLKGIAVVQTAFSKSFLGGIGPAFVTICLLFFAFTTIIGWYYFAETNVRFLFGKKGLTPFKILVVCFIVLGSALKLDLVWELADLFNGFMVIPNLIAILLLAKVAKGIMKDYDAGRPYVPFKEGSQTK